MKSWLFFVKQKLEDRIIANLTISNEYAIQIAEISKQILVVKMTKNNKNYKKEKKDGQAESDNHSEWFY